MRGVLRMIMTVASGVAALACQGCVQTQDRYSARPGPVTDAMQISLGEGTSRPAPRLQFTGTNTAITAGGLDRISQPVSVLGTVPQHQLALSTPSGPAGFSVSATKRAPSAVDGAAMSSTDILSTFTAELAAYRRSPEFDQTQSFSGELSFSAPGSATGLPLDVGFAPHLSIRDQGKVKSSRVGAEFRLGENLDERGEALTARSWYLFAGADGEALCWDVGDNGFATGLNGVRLRDQITVGDMQAGISVEGYGGRLSLSYIRREVEYKDRSPLRASENEDFAGISFTLRN